MSFLLMRILLCCNPQDSISNRKHPASSIHKPYKITMLPHLPKETWVYLFCVVLKILLYIWIQAMCMSEQIRRSLRNWFPLCTFTWVLGMNLGCQLYSKCFCLLSHVICPLYHFWGAKGFPGPCTWYQSALPLSWIPSSKQSIFKAGYRSHILVSGSKCPYNSCWIV